MKEKREKETILDRILRLTQFDIDFERHDDNTFTVLQSQQSGNKFYQIAIEDNKEWETAYDFSDSYVEERPKPRNQGMKQPPKGLPENLRRNQFIVLALLIIGLLSFITIQKISSKERPKEIKPASKTKLIMEGGVCTFDEERLGTVLYDDLLKVLEKDSNSLILEGCSQKSENGVKPIIYKGTTNLLNIPWSVQVTLDVDKPFLELKSLSKQFTFGFPNLFSPCMLATIGIGFIESLRKLNFCDSKINYKTFIYSSDTKELQFTGESKMFGVFKYLTKHINGYHQFTQEELDIINQTDDGKDSGKDIEKLTELKTANAKRLKVQVSGTIRPHTELFFIYNFDMQFDIATIMFPMLYLNFKEKSMKFNSITILNINHEADKPKEEEINIKDPNTDFDPNSLRSIMDQDFKYDYTKLSEIIPSKYTERYLVLGNFGEVSLNGFRIYGKLLKEFNTEIMEKSLKIFNGEIDFSINWNTKDTNKKFIDGSLLADMQMFNKTFFVNVNLNPNENQPYFYVLFTNTLLKDCMHKDINKLDDFTDQTLDDENMNCTRYIENNDVRDVDDSGYLPDLRGVFVLFLSKNNFEIEIKAINQTISFTDITGLTLAFNFNLTGSNSSKVLSVLKKSEQREDKFNLEFKGYISTEKIQIKGKLRNFYISEKFLLKDVLLIIQNKDPYVKITCKLLILEGTVDKEPREFFADIEIGDGYWYVYASYEAEWRFTMFDENFELNKVVFFLSKSETPSELPTKYLEELKTPGEEVENCGGIVGKLKADIDVGESNFDVFLIFSKCPDKTCLSIFIRKNEEGQEAGNVESLNSVFNKNQSFDFLRSVLPDGVYEDLFQNPPTDLTIEIKLICWEVKFRITLNSITFGKIKIAFDLLKLTGSVIEEQNELDSDSEGKEKPLYRINKNEEAEGFLFAFIILPEIDFNVDNSSLFNGIPKLSIFPPTLVLSNKRLDVNIPFRLPTPTTKDEENEEDSEGKSVVTKESTQKYIVYKTKPGLNIFARAKVKSNKNLKVVERFNVNYVDLKGYIGTLGIELSVAIKGNWQINKYLTIYDSSLSIGIMKKNKNSKLTPFLKLQATGIVKVLERQTLGSIVGDFSSSGIYILAKVCKMVSVEDSKSKEGLDLFTEEDFNKCATRKIDSFYDNNEQITEGNVDNYEDEENEQIKISIGNNRYIHIDTLQVEVRLLFSDIEINTDDNENDNNSVTKKNKKSKGVSITVLARSKMPSFTLTVSLTVGSSFAIVLAFVPKTDKFIGFGTAINELLAKDPSKSQTPSLTDMALPQEVTNSFNNKFQIKEFKASFTVANSTFEFKMKGMLKIYSSKYNALQTYDIDVFADEDNYRAQIVNLEHPEDPPIDFIRDIARLLGAKQVLVGVSKKPHLLKIPNTLDETGKPLRIYVTEGFYVMLVWSSVKPGTKEANSGNVTSKSGQSTLIVGGTFASISKWRISLYINKSFVSGSMTFTFASLFVERRGTLFGVGFSLTCLFEFSSSERLYLLGELAVYMALSGDGPALGLKVGMLEDWVHPFGVGGLVIKKTTIELILGLATLNPILFRLSGGLIFFSLNVDFVIYWDQTEAIDKKSVFYFRIKNFNFTKLLEMAFGKNKFTSSLSFIKIEFKYLEFKLATSTKSFAVVLDGTSYEVGFLLDIREFNFFDFLVGSIYLKFSKLGFHARGNIKPFNLLGLLRVSGVPNDAYSESTDDLRFELNTDPLNFRIYFSGRIVFLIFNIVGDIDISAKVFKIFLLINIDILSVDIIFIAIVKENLQNPERIHIYLELMDNGFGNNKSGQERFYAMRRRHGGISAVEGMNERKKGNTIDNTIEEEKPYGDDVKNKRNNDKRKKDGELNDAENSGGSIYQLQTRHYTSEVENRKAKKKAKLERLTEQLYNERKELNEMLYENKYRDVIMKIKYKIDKLRYSINKLLYTTDNKNDDDDDDLRNGIITTNYQIQMWWIFDAIINFFRRIINAIKRVINAIIRLINLIIDIIKKIIKFIISLLKKLINIVYLIGYAEIQPKNSSANVTVFIDIVLFSKWHIKVCETISFGSVQNAEKATGVVSKENDEDLQGSKREADHERGSKIVNQKEAGIIKNNVVKEYERGNEMKRRICEGKGF